MNLMRTLVEIINQQQAGLEKKDPTRLRLIEIAPRSEEFADSGLSCYICPNDPDEPDGWTDEEITEPGKKYNTTSAANVIESGGGQFYNLRFTIFFTLFYNDLGGVDRQKAFESSRIMLDRVHRAIFEAGLVTGGPFGQLQHKDDSKFHLHSFNNAVKKRRLIPAGSDTEPFYRGKMWLQFEVYMEG
jgi:hypothetical protein